MTSYLKDPDEVESYLVDFTSRLVTGETIASVEVVAPVGGVIVAPDGHNTTFTDNTVTIWLAGGTVGTKFNVSARATTSAGRVKEQSIRLRIFERSGTSVTVGGGVPVPTTVTDNGNGTATLVGSDVSDSGVGTFTVNGAVDNGNGTYTLAA